MGISVELKKYTNRELRFILYDEDKYSLPNLITKIALSKPGVTYAAYILQHPITSYPEIVILTDGSRDPLEILREVIEDIKNMAKQFLALLNEALSNASKEGVKNINSK